MKRSSGLGCVIGGLSWRSVFREREGGTKKRVHRVSERRGEGGPRGDEVEREGARGGDEVGRRKHSSTALEESRDIFRARITLQRLYVPSTSHLFSIFYQKRAHRRISSSTLSLLPASLPALLSSLLPLTISLPCAPIRTLSTPSLTRTSPRRTLLILILLVLLLLIWRRIVGLICRLSSTRVPWIR